MNSKKFAGIAILMSILIVGCSGKSGKLKSQSRQDSKATQQELVVKWSDYDIWFRNTVIVLDPKNDDKKILVGSKWGTVKNQETWMGIVKANTTSQGNIDPVWSYGPMTGVREIWGPDNQFYGYVIHQRRDLVNATMVDENTVRLWHRYANFGGP